jgi:hypothetical protein
MMPEIIKYVLVALFGLIAISNVLLVGQEREPTSPAMAAVSVIINATLITLIVIFL